MAPAPVFLSHPSSLEHDTRGHPEQAARIVAIERELAQREWLGFERVQSPAVSIETLTAVHPQAYVEQIEQICRRGGGQLDMDTLASEGSYEAALHAAGGAVALVDMLLDGSASCGFSAHRPPGHHALASRPMGFCLFANVSVAVRHALSRGVERVMVLDWDVHHGNGTQDIFYDVPQVLFVSIHQSPLWPGSGSVSEVGDGAGEGFNVNLPVPPRSGDETFASLVAHVAVPLVAAFEPQLVLVSSGYDAHRDDPLADCDVTEAGYAAMTAAVRAACGAVGAPIGVVLEGGYALDALARSVAVTMEALAGGEGSEVGVAPAARDAAGRLSRWWPEASFSE
jgi:acetoin utilization deacetylase AcuC-like enzyme